MLQSSISFILCNVAGLVHLPRGYFDQSCLPSSVRRHSSSSFLLTEAEVDIFSVEHDSFTEDRFEVSRTGAAVAAAAARPPTGPACRNFYLMDTKANTIWREVKRKQVTPISLQCFDSGRWFSIGPTLLGINLEICFHRGSFCH